MGYPSSHAEIADEGGGGGGGGEPVMETSSLLSEMTETQTISLTTLFPTR